MASRVIEAGTIAARVQNLLRAGVLQQRPLWLDVVEALPPLLPTQHNRTARPGLPRKITYPEDKLRREFLQRCVVLNEEVMSTETFFESEEHPPTICDKFVGEQLRRMRQGEGREDAAKAAFWNLRHSGVDIRVKVRGARKPDLELLGVPSDKAEKSATVSTLKDLLASLDHTRD